MKSFWRLNNDRQISASMGGIHYGGIPFTAIERFAERYGITSIDTFDAFLDIIKALDSTYISIRTNGVDLTKEVTPEDSDYVRQLLSPQAAPDDDSNDVA